MFEWKSLFRRKQIPQDVLASKLRRSLSLYHVVFLGVASLVGAGIFTVTGSVVRYTAGPSTIIAYIIAALTAVLSAVCYAEFASRVPRVGSAYVYSYVTCGELPAFVVGWNFLLENIIGCAAVAMSGASYMLALSSPNHIHTTNTTSENATDTLIDELWTDQFWEPLLLASAIIIACTIFSVVGAKFSASITSALTSVTVLVLVFFIIYGLQFADFDLWSPFREPGEGFLPFGYTGVLYAATSLFFCYSGFDNICTVTEEVKDPQKNIPRAILLVLCLVTVLYVLCTTTLVLMVPYDLINANNALATVFAQVGRPWAKYIVIVGAIIACVANVSSGAFCTARLFYAMSIDGLLFAWIGTVNETTQVPINAAILAACANIFFIIFFNLQTLVEFLAIGTLIAYTTVVLSVLILRYRPVDQQPIEQQNGDSQESTPLLLAGPPRASTDITIATYEDCSLTDTADGHTSHASFKPWLLRTGRRLPRWLFHEHDAYDTALVYLSIIISALLIIVLSIRVFDVIGLRCHPVLTWTVVMFGVFGCILAAIFCKLLSGIRQVDQSLSFKVPFAPWLPLLSIFANILLIAFLDPFTWIRFAVWMTFGAAMYVGYSYPNSEVAKITLISNIEKIEIDREY